ncbi:MAG: ribose-5-phosphate isomerase RpiA [Desulfobacterales bacterium]|nr:ribose-5-phosphate isomerase RpiA [Desulfobacterales bacterium]MDD4073514.1 ribose-5-phosphate isomerase RpiA [Desulfobacterales bacterium]MDD4393149.1 ribose-5-phosphate isomerase RpiA [Desulfobacterales bacterium]
MRDNADPQGQLKQQAAQYAVEFVRSGMIIGLGSGSTVRFALELIGHRITAGRLTDVLGIASSMQTGQLAESFGIPLTDLDWHPRIDMVLDGADEVDPHLNLIKGGGGALLREKILAQASRRNVIIVDETKLSLQLGTHCRLPVEVIPFALKPESEFIESELGAQVTIRKTADDKRVLTDQGNVILDCRFGSISRPDKLASMLDQRAGIVGHGLFLNLASEVIVGGVNGPGHLKR